MQRYLPIELDRQSSTSLRSYIVICIPCWLCASHLRCFECVCAYACAPLANNTHRVVWLMICWTFVKNTQKILKLFYFPLIQRLVGECQKHPIEWCKCTLVSTFRRVHISHFFTLSIAFYQRPSRKYRISFPNIGTERSVSVDQLDIRWLS